MPCSCGRAGEAGVVDYANVPRSGLRRPLLLYFATSPTPASPAVTLVLVQQLNIWKPENRRCLIWKFIERITQPEARYETVPDFSP